MRIFLPCIKLKTGGFNKRLSESADIPVCSSLGMVGGAEELIDRADSDPSRPEGTAGAAGEGVTAESCTCRR